MSIEKAKPRQRMNPYEFDMERMEREMEMERKLALAHMEAEIAIMTLSINIQIMGGMMLNPNCSDQEICEAMAILSGTEYVPPPRTEPDARWFAA